MSNRIRALATAFATISLAACVPDHPTAPHSQSPAPRGANADFINLTTDPVLFSQTSTSTALIVQEEAFGGSTYIADDFVVPEGQIWTVTGIGRSGHAFVDSPIFFFWRDTLGQPGRAVSGTNLTVGTSDPASCCGGVTDYLERYQSVVKLKAGRYWVGSSWTIETEDKQFGWQPATGSGLGPMVSNTGGSTWSPLGAAGLAFSVFGQSRLVQTITFPAITPSPAATGTSATLGATATSNLAVTYKSLTADVCTISGTLVQFIKAGTCTVQADQAGDATYAPADGVTQTVTVFDLSSQTITFSSTPPAPAYVGGKYTVSATGGASGNPVVITASPSSVCTGATNVVTFVGVGTCTVAANQAGNAAYAPATQVTQTIKVDYQFGGFGDPVKGGVLNVSKTGKTIPLKWRITDANGAPITNLAQATVTVADLPCSLGTSANQLTESAAGNSGLQNLGNGYYQFNWKVPSSYANSCKTLQLSLGEGSGVRTVQFEFTK